MVNVQVKRVPQAWHLELKRRAEVRGISLNDLLLEVLERETSRMPIEEWNQRAKALGERVDLTDDTRALLASTEFWDDVKGREAE